MNCREVQEEIAVALLTRESLGADASAHVSTCPDCAAEQASLRSVSAIMAEVSRADITTADVPLPNDVHLARILHAVGVERAKRRRRSVTRGLALAAAAIVVAVGIGVGISMLAPDNRVITATASAAGLSASADIVSDGDGSQLTLSVTGVPKGTYCVLTVHTADGETEQVLAWTAEYEGKAHVVTTSRAAPDTITRVTLTEGNGATLLVIPVDA